MADTDTHGNAPTIIQQPAFPEHPYNGPAGGMTLRDYFAAAAAPIRRAGENGDG